MSGGGAKGSSSGAAAKRIVQSLKEIVNCPEAEIYAALKDCDMDPDAAVNRLLSQDTFQEVKSKREKKKEVKEAPEPRSRTANNNTSNRGPRGVADRGGRNPSFQSSSIDNLAPRSSILGPVIPPYNPIQKPTVQSSSSSKDREHDGTSASLQPSLGFQHSWSGMTGQRSMADIVKMGRPQVRPSSKPAAATDRSYIEQVQNSAMPSMVNHWPKQSAVSSEFDQGLPAPQDPVAQLIEVSDDGAVADDQQTYHNDWSAVDEPPSGNLPESSGPQSLYAGSLESSTVLVDAVNFNGDSLLVENKSMEHDVDRKGHSVSIRSASASDRQIQMGSSEYYLDCNDGIFKKGDAHQSENHAYANDEVDDADVDANFQHLSLNNEEPVATKASDDSPAVIIPDHLQVTNADCAHLSFGSFESGAFSGYLASNAPRHIAEASTMVEDSPPVDQIDVRTEDYYNNGALRASMNESVGARIGTDIENVDAPSVSEADVLRHGALDASELQYNLPSVSGHTYSNSTEPSSVEFPQGNTQTQNLSAFSSLLANSLPNSLLAQNMQPLRDFDFSLSPLITSQSMATKYSAAVASTSGQSISMQEAAKLGAYSTTQSTPNQPSTSIATGPPLPQQLAMHPYSQPTLPLGHFAANLIGYPFLPQSYAYLSSAAFQQAYPSNGPFQQSATAVPSTVSGYGGGFGSSSNIPGSFTMNPGTASAATTHGFDEALSTQYKDASHYMALQQGDNSAMWLHGAGSRTMSALPASNFYGYQGQSQHSSFRQGQQPSQFGALGYPNFYQSQTGLAQEHPQNPSDGGLNGSQAAGSQPSHQLWHHTY